MKAVKFYGVGDLRIEEVETPTPNEDQVLVKVRSSGICGSDVNIFSGKSEEGVFPYLPGHEWSGEVAEIGSGVGTFRIGDRVVGETVEGCGVCDVCRRGGNPNYCRRPTTYGFQPKAPGAFAEFVVRKETNLHKLPDSVSFDIGALVEPVSVAYHALWKIGGGVLPSDILIIFGAGPIGLFTLALAKSCEARVICIDPVESRRRLAKEIGADETVDPSTGESVREVLSLTNGRGGTIAIETSGSDLARASLPDVVDCNGKLILVGISRPSRTPFELEKLISKGLVMKGAEGSPLMFPPTIDFVAKHHDTLSKAISHRFALDEASLAFKMSENRKETVKVLLNC